MVAFTCALLWIVNIRELAFFPLHRALRFAFRVILQCNFLKAFYMFSKNYDVIRFAWHAPLQAWRTGIRGPVTSIQTDKIREIPRLCRYNSRPRKAFKVFQMFYFCNCERIKVPFYELFESHQFEDEGCEQ